MEKNEHAVALGKLGGKSKSKKKLDAIKKNGFQPGWRKKRAELIHTLPLN